MNALQTLIVETVEERYYKNTDFYLPLRFNSSTWNNFKQGITDINNMKYARVQAILDTLFSDYEMHLFRKAELYGLGEADPVLWHYRSLKRDAVRNLADDLIIEVRTQTDEHKGLLIIHGDDPFIKLHFKPIHLSEGLTVDKTYILENVDLLG